MTTIDFEKIKASRLPAYRRQLIRIPNDIIGCHYSSLTDYLDNLVGYNREGMKKIDSLIERYHLGAVSKLMNGHFGTVLPCINRKNDIVGGSVIYFDTINGKQLQKDPLTEHLYQWYCFDYYVDGDIFFGEHLLSCKPVAIVQEEKTVLLGALAMKDIDWLAIGLGNNLTDMMVKKMLGRQVILFPDDMSFDYYDNHFGSIIKVDKSFIETDINDYLADIIRKQYRDK